ncbi:MAG: GNAT family N-acetyltransferase [Gemmatimonadetes bacterium]|nr:GNAT family N-acetyltransferase [Gemmatimonadota bacterium]MBT5058915.1 GNAT family N-acetyltransferase [Gemmatimonadota bacterium]MBT5144377.1 GNAT family N-acetyltransferase [Gemmatimonadota bacterium]MBT5587105.1 GNAT family N-acetyltransferase [Gemmatimonadota bacterium]MBT5960373.1 GNAT family N-acetyltransferase [Gemmatimonadota bacterium]
MRVDVANQVDLDVWNQQISGAEHATIHQTASLGEFYRSHLGYDVFYLRCFEGDQLVALLTIRIGGFGQAQLIERPMATAGLRLSRWLKPLLSWQQGPVFLGDPERWPSALAALVDAVRSHTPRARFSGITLPIGLEALVENESLAAFDRLEWATYLVDLRVDEEELWNGLKRSARKAIRKAERDGLEVQLVDGEQGRLEYQPFRRHCLQARGARVTSAANYIDRHRLLRSIDGEEVYIAVHQGETISGLGVFRFNGQISEFGSHQTPESVAQKLNGNDLLKWEILRRERSKGGRVFDLTGVNPNPASPKERGIAQFKAKWGGVFHPYPVLSRT